MLLILFVSLQLSALLVVIQKVHAVDHPTIYTFDLGSTADRADWYDKEVFVTTIQGIVNREAPRLYLNYQFQRNLAQSTFSDSANSTAFWWDKFRQRGQWLSEYNVENISTLDELVTIFKDDLNGLVAWDPKVDSTVNVATTIAGVDDLAAVMYGGALYNKYTAAPYNLTVQVNLNNQFSGANQKAATYDWAIQNYLVSSGTSTIAYFEDGFARQMNTMGNDLVTTGRDYLVKKRAFVFDLSPWSDEKPVDAPEETLGKDYNTFTSMLQAAYNGHGVKWPIKLIGFTPMRDKYSNSFQKPSQHEHTEWEMMEVLSQYNVAIVDTNIHGINASLHSWAPIGSQWEPQQKSPPRKALGATYKTYITFFQGDHDGSTLRSMYYLWEDAHRGNGAPIGISMFPTMFEHYSDVAKYYYETATDKDYFWAGASGAGYTNPEYWAGADLKVWEKYNDYWYDKAGITMTGFLLNGNAQEPPAAVENAYGRFGHDGIIGQEMNSPNPDVRANNTVILEKLSDFNANNLQTAKSNIVNALSGKNPGGQFNFVVVRAPWVYPYYVDLLMDKLKTELPSYNFEVVDPYTIFSLARQQINNQVNDSIDIDVDLPDGKLVAGEKYDVSITVRNVGYATWTQSNSYKLGTTSNNELLLTDFEDGGFGTVPGNQRVHLSMTDSIAPQQTKTFNFKIQAPSTAGVYDFDLKMVREGVEWFGSSISRSKEVINPPDHAAQIVSVSAPEYVEEGTNGMVTVQVKNIGSETWTLQDDYRLGAVTFSKQYPKVTDNEFRWNGSTGALKSQRIELDTLDSIAPGDTKTFTFTVKAPDTRGTYTLSGRMVQEHVEWFGDHFEQDIIVVPPGRTGKDFHIVGETVPEYMKTGNTHRVSITVKNLGSETWTNATNFVLKAGSNNDFTFSGFKDGGYSNSAIDQGVYLSADDEIKPEETKTFIFEITAPGTSGNYQLEVDMFAGSTAFGHILNIPIEVNGNYAAEFADENVPVRMAAGSIQNIRMEVINGGGNAWTRGASYRLGSTSNNEFAFVNIPNGGDTSNGIGNQRVYMREGDVILTGDSAVFLYSVKAPSTPGTYTFEVRMVRDGVSWFGDTKTITIEVVASYVVNVNAGGSGYTDSQGAVWSSDQAYTTGNWGYYGGSNTISTSNAIWLRNTGFRYIHQTTFKTARHGVNFGYKFDVPNGTYRVELAVAEIYLQNDRTRVFDMIMEGDTIWASLDPFKQTFGHDKGHNPAFYVVEVTDGQLNIDFSAVVNGSMINGIKVERLSD